MSMVFVSLLLRIFLFFFFFFESLVQSHFMDQFSHLVINLRLQLHNSFFLNFIYCFLILARYGLETCVNCFANCVAQKFYPLKSKFYNNKKCRCHFMDNLGNYSTYLSPHYQNSFSPNLNFFSVLVSLVSKNICKLRHKLKN